MEHCEIMIGDIGHPEPASLRRTFRLDAIISDNLQQCHLTLIDFSDTREALQTVITKEAKYRCLFEASQEVKWTPTGRQKVAEFKLVT
jgi:hypothetical protein